MGDVSNGMSERGDESREPAEGPQNVELSVVLKVLAWVLLGGFIIKMGLIGFYTSELPWLIAWALAAGLLFWIGSKIDGWDRG